jgi:NAD(P)-dependent dehydrogenase (short-subunit alcohol dehydrogenase family)
LAVPSQKCSLKRGPYPPSPTLTKLPSKPHPRAKVFIADRDLPAAESFAASINKDSQSPVAYTHAVNVTCWEEQVTAFTAAVKQLNRIDYVYPIAGIGERMWTANRPKATGFEKPDLSVLDVDVTGVLYTVSLALQQMRRQEKDGNGFRGKSECK